MQLSHDSSFCPLYDGGRFRTRSGSRQKPWQVSDHHQVVLKLGLIVIKASYRDVFSVLGPNLVKVWVFCREQSGAFKGQFLPLLAARARGWGQFGASFSPNSLNDHKSGSIGQTVTTWYQWGPFAAILGHFGVNLAARARGWGQFGANFSPFRPFKTAPMTTNQARL